MDDEQALLCKLESTHGLLLDQRALATLLGFASKEGCAKALRTGALGIAAFRLPGRPGYFVMTKDYVSWLLANKQASACTSREQTPAEDAEPLNRQAA